MNVKNALTRKWGPLPAWGWFTGLFIVIYLYRRYNANNLAYVGTGTGSVAPASGPPQSQVTLQPGESAYDPNTGALITAPGGGAGDTSSANDLGAAMDNLASAIASGMPATQVHVTGPNAPAPAKPKLGKGGIWAPFGHNRPADKKGYTTKGLGRGFWEYLPKKAKPRGQTSAKRVSKVTPAGSKQRARSNAAMRTQGGGRTSGRRMSILPAVIKRGSPQYSAAQGLRQRPKTPAVSTTVRQRRPAAPPMQRSKQSAAPAHRPSAPAPRTQRSPARAPAKRSPRKRK